MIRPEEVWRLMGCRAEPDEQVKALAESCVAELEAAVTPRFTARREKLLLDGALVRMGGLEVRSESLAKHLKGCTEVILFAATLGTAADQLLRRSAVRSVSRGSAMDAAASAMIEAFCDEQTASMQRAETRFRSRFGPGYGDLPLEFQRPLLRYLEADRRIGLSVTDSLMLVPVKSLTAIIGVAKDGEQSLSARCAVCSMTGCPFRSV